MKEIVIEQLRQRDLMHIYSDALFKEYLSKIRRTRKGGNNYLAALHVFDLFIINSAVA